MTRINLLICFYNMLSNTVYNEVSKAGSACQSRFPFGFLILGNNLRANHELGASTTCICVLSETALTGLDLSLHSCLFHP